MRYKLTKVEPQTYQRRGSLRPRTKSRGGLREALFLVAGSLTPLATSKQRGTMSQLQEAIDAVHGAGIAGITNEELTLILGYDVHVCGNLLSKAHRDKAIYRLGAKRANQKIYIAEEFLNGKTHQAYGFGGSKIKLRGTWSELSHKKPAIQDALPMTRQ